MANYAPDIAKYLQTTKNNFIQKPTDSELRFDYIFALYVSGEEDEAIHLNKIWLHENPKSKYALYLRGLLKKYRCLPPEEWVEDYEHGFGCGKRVPLRRFDCHRWKGQDIKNRKLLFWAEGGIGDVLRDIGYLKKIDFHKSEITFEVPEKLLELLAYGFPNITFVKEKIEDCSTAEQYDFECPTGSLCSVVNEGSVPILPNGYLKP